MQRYMEQFERLASNLRKLGYVFEEEPITEKNPQCDELITEIEEELWPIPKALKEFYKTIGGINFIGAHPSWKKVEYPDPAVIFPIEIVYAEFEELQGDKEEYLNEHEGKFLIPIAPDFYHKQDVSGGMFYHVPIPNKLDDPVVEEEPHGLVFTKYLEHALTNGGFCALDGKGTEYGYPMGEILNGVL